MSHREEYDDYDRVILRWGKWRVIECRDAIQWILQEFTGNRWRNQYYCTSRDGILRRAGQTVEGGWDALRDLPMRFEAGTTLKPAPTS